MHRGTGGGWEAIAARQHGLISRSQALGAGLTRAQVNGFLARGSWIRTLPCVFRIAASPVVWQQPLMAGCLWAKGEAAAFGRSAAALWEFEGYWRTRVTLCGRRDLSPPSGIEYRQVGLLGPADLRIRSSIRVTSVARTILDLASIVPPRTLERTLDEALRKELVTPSALQACLDRNRRRGRQGIGGLLTLLEERRGQLAPDSVLESDVAATMREHGIPPGVTRYLVVEGDHFVCEVDLAWPRQKVAVQVHGSSFHRQLRTWENDQRVENLLQLHGWLVVKITYRMLEEDPSGCAALVKRALSRTLSKGVGDALRSPATPL